MIDNTKQILDVINFTSEDDFYFMQVIMRRKENPDIGSDNIVLDSFYCNEANIEKNIKLAIQKAKLFNARVYFHLNKKSYSKVGILTLKIISQHIYNNSFPAIKNAYQSACGQYTTNGQKYWVIDIDTKDERILDLVYGTLMFCKPEHVLKVLCTIPTKNGYHVITTPFDIKKFKELIPGIIDVHKNNPTLLFAL